MAMVCFIGKEYKMKKLSTISILLSLIGCNQPTQFVDEGVLPVAGAAAPITQVHTLPPARINDNDAGIQDADAGDPLGNPFDGGSLSISDVREAVAYCAGAILDPKNIVTSCNSLVTNEKLTTVCNTNLEIRWNCAACGEAYKNDVIFGDILMISNQKYRITNAAAKIWKQCLVSNDGKTFEITNFN
jgi:hypothetical protein